MVYGDIQCYVESSRRSKWCYLRTHSSRPSDCEVQDQDMGLPFNQPGNVLEHELQ
jgi:hypothetical protein